MTDWKKFFRELINKKWLLVLMPILSVSIASYVSLNVFQPHYEASTKLFVLFSSNENPNNITYDDLLASQFMARNYKELIQSSAVTSEVIDRLNLDGITDEDLADSIDVVVIPDSSAIRILVQDDNADLVVDIANELSSVFIQKAEDLLKISNISLVDKAIVSEKVSPKPFLIISISLLFGIVLALGLILLFAFFNDTIGNSEEVEKITGLNVVGIIPNMKIR